MLSTLMNDMKSAMKAGEKSELGALRNLIGKVKAKQIDSGKDLRINLDIFTDFPPNRLRHILNPMHFGGVLEYRSIATYRTPRNMRSSTFRLYVRDQYSTLGPMIFDLGGEFVSFLESGNQLDANLTEIDEEPTKFRLNPSLSTIVNLNSQWKMQVELYGATEIPQLSAIYFFSALNKYGSDWMEDGTAVYYFYQLQENPDKI